MSELSPRLALPLIQPAQSQKHVTHNEALDRLDVVVQLVVQEFGANIPPVDPRDGMVWALGPTPIGAWAGHALALASWRGAAWAFATPATGWIGFGPDGLRRFDGADWISTLGADDLQNLAGVGINASSDAGNRLSVASTATLLNHEGAGHQLKINKAGTSDTASLLFQSNFAGRAEMGLAGGDDFSIKVSPDGSNFATALTMAAANGRVSAPVGLDLADGSTASPALSFAADSDTGLTRPASNKIGLVTGGAVRATLSNSELQVEVQTTIRFDAPSTFYDTALDNTLLLIRGGTAAQNAYGASLGFSKIGSTSRVCSVVALKQTSADADQCGLAFFTHPSSNTGSNLIEQMVIRHDGFVGIGVAEPSERLQVAGTVRASNLLRGTSQVFSRDNLVGAVGQTAGLPTGAVVERGSNANGNYVRFADGTMRCTQVTLSAANCSTTDGAIFRSGDVGWTFPSTFASAPVVTGSADDIDNWLSTGTPTTNACALRVKSSVTKPGAIPVRVVAHGRWF
jgi:hypothetical protein